MSGFSGATSPGLTKSQIDAMIYNGLDKTASGFMLDARAGKTLDDAKVNYTDVVNNLSINDTTGTKPAGQQEVYQLNNLTKNTILFITKTSVSITDGSSSTPGYINVDLTSDVGNTSSLWGADVYISYNGTIYKLPYMHNSNGTYLQVDGYSGKTITLKNTTSGWGSCTLHIVAFVARS